MARGGPRLTNRDPLAGLALEVNLCRVFKLAKEVAESGKPLNYQIMPMMDAAGGLWCAVFFFGLKEHVYIYIYKYVVLK